MRAGLIGARGYTGRELLRLLDEHPGLEVARACSAAAEGTRVRELVDGFSSDLTFTAPRPESVLDLDVVFLALPNATSGPYVEMLEARAPETVVVDLSADHRFDDTWTYGLVEKNRARLKTAKRIANPGCYATGAQLALMPFADDIDGLATVFGVSGYSGAGTTPSPKNDPARLAENLIPYGLSGHVHEREISRHTTPVAFHPHVASYFRGISLTVSFSLGTPRSVDELLKRLDEAYADEALVDVVEMPEVRDFRGRHHVGVGGLSTLGSRVVLVSALDNLLKGAATQALQSANLALGFNELAGIPVASQQSRS